MCTSRELWLHSKWTVLQGKHCHNIVTVFSQIVQLSNDAVIKGKFKEVITFI